MPVRAYARYPTLSPSEYVSAPSRGLARPTGTDGSVRGMLTGIRPGRLLEAGAARPASAWPNSWPGNHTCRIAPTRSAHGISTGMPLLTTTTVRGQTAATSSTSASWRPGRARVLRS